MLDSKYHGGNVFHLPGVGHVMICLAGTNPATFVLVSDPRQPGAVATSHAETSLASATAQVHAPRDSGGRGLTPTAARPQE